MRKIIFLIIFCLVSTYSMAATFSMKEGVSGYSGAIDSWGNASSTTTNYGNNTILSAGDGSRHKFFFDFDTSSITGNIIGANFVLFEDTRGGQHTLVMHGLLRDWVESEVTYTIWKTSNNWTTLGAESDGNDWDSTYSATNPNGNGGFVYFDGAEIVNIVEGMIDGTYPGGIVVAGSPYLSGNGWDTFSSSENATTGNRPELKVATGDSSGGTTCGSGTGCTLSGYSLGLASGNNRLVVAGCTTEGPSNISDMTFDGVSGTEEIEFDFEGNATISYWYWLDTDLPSSAGNYDIVCTATATISNFNVLAVSMGDMKQQGPDDTDTASCNNCSTLTVVSTPLSADSIIIDIIDTGGTASADFDARGVGQVSILETDASSSSASLSMKSQGASAFTMSWTAGASQNRNGVVACAWATEAAAPSANTHHQIFPLI